MCAKVPKNFKFAAKLTRTMTHEIKKGAWQKEVLLYRQGIAPLIQSKKLLCILIQLPPWFKRSINYRHYLAALLDELAGLPLPRQKCERMAVRKHAKKIQYISRCHKKQLCPGRKAGIPGTGFWHSDAAL